MNQKLLLLFFALFLGLTGGIQTAFADGCKLVIRTPYTYVRIADEKYLEYLENANRLKTFCPLYTPCDKNVMKAKHESFTLYKKPRGHSIGSLIVHYTPGQGPNAGITATVRAGVRSTPFVPPLYDEDWGYELLFHATLLDRQKDWFKIAVPLITAAWVHMPDAKVVSPLDHKEQVYRFQGRGIVLQTGDATSLTYRSEQPADMWCDEGVPPPRAQPRFIKQPLSYFYDSSCNLQITVAYPRGC